MMKTKPEILSPAGDAESLQSAIDFGADAVYLAGRKFGMRSASKNFDGGELRTACLTAHKRGVKVYVACNILPRSAEMNELPEFLELVGDCGADALIIADLGTMKLAQKYAPGVALHVSTQAGVTNYETARVLYNMGAARVVTARELPISEIALMRAKIPKELEIECFVHGAMCVSFSGRCLISSYLTGRDANHGECAQPCRWKYHLYEENREGNFYPVEEDDSGTFLYNSRDMCMIEHLPELIEAGASSLKIEGRAKSAYYTAVVTNAYRHAVDDYADSPEGGFVLKPWIKEELDKISHREYSTGFYLGGEPGQQTGSGGYIRHYDQAAFCEEAIDSETSLITQRNKFYVGDELDVLPPGGVPFKIKCLSLATEDGAEVESAPHPMQRLIMKSTASVPSGSMLRIKR